MVDFHHFKLLYKATQKISRTFFFFSAFPECEVFAIKSLKKTTWQDSTLRGKSDKKESTTEYCFSLLLCILIFVFRM